MALLGHPMRRCLSFFVCFFSVFVLFPILQWKRSSLKDVDPLQQLCLWLVFSCIHSLNNMWYGVSLHASLCLWCLFVLLLLFSLHHTLAITPVAPTTIAVTGPTASPMNIAAKPPSPLARHCYLGNVLSSSSSLYPLNWSSPLQNVLSKLSPMVVFGGKCVTNLLGSFVKVLSH